MRRLGKDLYVIKLIGKLTMEELVMKKGSKILCPIDFSEGSDHAMLCANELAQLLEAEVHCVHVIDLIPLAYAVHGIYVSSASLDATIASIEEHTREEFEKRLHKYELMHLQAEGHFLHGKPAQEVVGLADELDVDYIMITTHGRSGFDALISGSTCEKIVRLSHVPVITLKHPEHFLDENPPKLQFQRILCPLDFSDFSKKALDVAVDICKEFGGTLILAHAVDTRLEYPMLEPGVGIQDSLNRQEDAQSYLETIAQEIKEVFTEIRVVIGSPYSELVTLMKNEEIDLVVMTTHGHRGLSHLLLGSNAERLVRLAPCPVMTIHPDQESKKKHNSATAIPSAK